MEINDVVNMILPIVFGLVGIALIFLVIELIKVLKVTRSTIEDIKPKLDATMKNVEDITTNLQPTLAKVDPMMDSVQLTIDSVNLEMMRVDQILEDVTAITDTASSATAAVDNITNAPLQAVNSMASRVRSAFGGKKASDESAQLAEQRMAVAHALEEYRATEGKAADAKAVEGATISELEKPAAEPAVAAAAAEPTAEPEPAAAAEPTPTHPNSYVKDTGDDSELVIDPKTIAESSFFDDAE